MSVHTAGWDGSNPVEHANFFDSRDIIARIEWLESEIESLTDEIGDNTAPDDYVGEREDLVEYRRELTELQAFAADGPGSDWEYGNTFISDDYFETYAEEFANDIGAINSEASWPLNHIDWEAAADDLKQDYNAYDLTLDGVTRTYWAR